MFQLEMVTNAMLMNSDGFKSQADRKFTIIYQNDLIFNDKKILFSVLLHP